MNSKTTDNVLTDFDICLAVAEQAINTQMTYAWKVWKRRQNFHDKIDIFKKQKVKDGPIEDSKAGLEATFYPLKISLSVPDGKLGQVQVNLTMQKGKVTYFDEGEANTYSFQSVPITFLVDLDKSPAVSLEALKAIDSNAGEIADETIKQSGLSESVFSIEYLFLKFTEIDLENLPENRFGFESGAPIEAITIAKKALNLLLWGKLAPETDKAGGRFILGTVVRRNTTQTVPTFTMIDFLFDVNANWTSPAASTLNYLGVFKGATLPADRNAARLKLRNPWLQPEQIDSTGEMIAGVMGFRKGRFMDEYLIRNFSDALGREPQTDRLKWIYKETITEPEIVIKSPSTLAAGAGGVLMGPVGVAVGGALEQVNMFNVTKSYEISIEIVPDSNQLTISGKVSSSVHYDGSSVGFTDKSKCDRWNYTEGYIPLSGTLTLTGENIGTNFSLKGVLKYEFGTPVVTRDVTGGTQNIDEYFAKGLKAIGIIASTPDEILDSAAASMQTQLREALDNQLKQVQVDFSDHKFIPPGTSIFTFRNPLFTQAGDIFLDVIYQAT